MEVREWEESKWLLRHKVAACFTSSLPLSPLLSATQTICFGPRYISTHQVFLKNSAPQNRVIGTLASPRPS